MVVLGAATGLCSLSVAGAALAAPAAAAPAAPAPAAAAPAAPADAPKAPPDAATKKAAREAYGAGEKAYAAGDFTGALTQFRKAHSLIPTIHAEFWIAMSLSKGSDVAGAYDALAAVIGSPDAAKLGEEKTGMATARLAELKKVPATMVVSTTPPGAQVLLDDAPQPGQTPMTVSLPAGTHRLMVVAKGYDAHETDVTAKPGQQIDQKIELHAAPEAPVAAAPAAPPPAAEPEKAAPPPPPPKEQQSKLPAYITLGVGAVGAGVGTIFGIQALGAKSDFDKHPTNANADKAERNALIADMGFAVALTLGITGIVLLTTGDEPNELSASDGSKTRHVAKTRLDVAPVVTPTTQGAAARLTF